MSDYDYEVIRQRMLDRIDDKFDKREGSIIDVAIAPAAFEFAQLYREHENAFEQAFADTANMYYLEARAKERKMYPRQATHAIMKGQFNIPIERGTKFTAVNSDINYISDMEIASEDEFYYYQLISTEAGTTNNDYVGDIIPIDGDIEGLAVSEIIGTVTYGEDAETVEEFRERYLDSFVNLSFGGNINDYKEKMYSISGVGGVKVYPMWATGNLTEVVFTNNLYEPPSPDLIEYVKNILVPVPLDGVGELPIGHDVIFTAAETEEIKVDMTITYEDTYGWEDVCDEVIRILSEYFKELNTKWEDLDNIVIRISQIESRLLDIPFIIDIQNTVINGSEKNFTTGANNLVKLISVNGVAVGVVTE